MDLKQKMMISPLYDLLGKRSYSQAGEDLVADAEMGKKKLGFYVDIGAYHPKMFSNTYLFYKRGWSGICVDPNPILEEMFAKARPKDRFVNVGVGEKEEVKEYFMFSDSAANTFSEEQAKKNINAGRKQTEKRMVAILPLSEIMGKYLPNPEIEIDLLSVDVEGMDEEVLRSNDWKKYKPKMIIAEDLDFDFRDWKKSGVVKYLDTVGYELIDKTPYSLIFRLKK